MTRNTRPRQRTGMFSPNVISEGILSVISTTEPSCRGASVKKNTPRELRSCVKPWPSIAVATSRTKSGSRNENRCPTRRSTRTGGEVLKSLPSPGGPAVGVRATVAHYGGGEKLQVGYIGQVIPKMVICLLLDLSPKTLKPTLQLTAVENFRRNLARARIIFRVLLARSQARGGARHGRYTDAQSIGESS